MNLLSSLSSSSEIKVVLLAAAGGVAVFIGLLLEKIAEARKQKYAPSFFNPLHWLATLGWTILMAGIVIEIADAGWTAHEINKNNATNQPINTDAEITFGTCSIIFNGTFERRFEYQSNGWVILPENKW